MSERIAVVGGAGFIGSHFVDALLDEGNKVVVVDNFCSGTRRHLDAHNADPNLEIQSFDVENTDRLISAFEDVATVIHLASNPDIAKAAIEPRIDFTQGTVLTESVVEASRIAGVATILYASGSGVYGDAGTVELNENSPLNPISTYGASKLAGESLLSSYAYMFGIRAIAFRFANVVGDMQTHGVGFDFLRRLKEDSSQLHILGDGKQSKSYVHVTDVVKAVMAAKDFSQKAFDIFNISTADYLSVNEIALMAIETLGLKSSDVRLSYSGGDRGWKADVPIVRLDASKILSRGWIPQYSSRSAMKSSLAQMALEI